MADPITCPHCRVILTDSQIRRMHQQYASAQRKVRAGGHNGGRPPKYPDRVDRYHTSTPGRPAPAVDAPRRRIVPIEEI